MARRRERMDSCHSVVWRVRGFESAAADFCDFEILAIGNWGRDKVEKLVRRKRFKNLSIENWSGNRLLIFVRRLVDFWLIRKMV